MPPRVNNPQPGRFRILVEDSMDFLSRVFKPRSVKYLLKNLFLSAFKIRNLKTLMYRMMTVLMVIAHYTLVESIPLNQMVHNEWEFGTLLIVWHFLFMNYKIIEESRRRKNEEHFHIRAGLIGLLSIVIALVILMTPFFSYYDSRFTQLKSNYWTLRYIMLFLYILMNIAINTFPLVNNFMFFLSDGIILSQLTSLYLYNEFSMSAMLTTLPFLFVLQNHGLIKGIKNFTRDEQNQKLSFVRLIGRHDAVFLFVIYTIFTLLFNIVDFFSSNYIFGINMWYIVYALYIFGRLMDNKNIGSLKYVSFISVVIYGMIYCYTLTYHSNPFPERRPPLYNETIVSTNITNYEFANTTIQKNNLNPLGNFGAQNNIGDNSGLNQAIPDNTDDQSSEDKKAQDNAIHENSEEQSQDDTKGQGADNHENTKEQNSNDPQAPGHDL